MENVNLTYNGVKFYTNNNDKLELVRDIIRFKLIFNNVYNVCKNIDMSETQKQKLNELKDFWLSVKYNNDLCVFYDLKELHKYINGPTACPEWNEYVEILMSWRVRKLGEFFVQI